MLLIPAIDLKDGQCVRLRRGDMDDATIFSDDPVAVAGRWFEAGARRLHMVDLDGAFAGEPVNAGIIKAITREYPSMPVQVGGGIRDEETVAAYVEAGVSYVIIGTKAVQEPAFVGGLCKSFPGKVIVGLDAKNGDVAVDGWATLSGKNVLELAQAFADDGVAAIVYTDIARDGMMQGVNVQGTADLAKSINIPIIASGGITNLDDVHALAAVASSGITGAITGRAIYEGTLDFKQAQALADQLCSEQ